MAIACNVSWTDTNCSTQMYNGSRSLIYTFKAFSLVIAVCSCEPIVQQTIRRVHALAGLARHFASIFIIVVAELSYELQFQLDKRSFINSAYVWLVHEGTKTVLLCGSIWCLLQTYHLFLIVSVVSCSSGNGHVADWWNRCSGMEFELGAGSIMRWSFNLVM